MLITIITINYNNRNGLEKTIKSVQDQTYKDFEYIVIDGNSSDGSKEVINKYNDLFSYSISEPDTGVYQAMNKGIRASKGVYLFFLNSGDTFYNSEVLKLVSIKITNDKAIYYGNMVLEDNKGNQKTLNLPKIMTFSFLFQKNIPHQSAFIKKTLFDRIFYYNEKLKIVSDWEFFICAICKYNVPYQHIDIIISNYDTTGISSDPENKKTYLKERKICLENHFPLFVEDQAELIKLRNRVNSYRFKMLAILEKSKTARRINNIWLKILVKIFN